MYLAGAHLTPRRPPLSDTHLQKEKGPFGAPGVTSCRVVTRDPFPRAPREEDAKFVSDALTREGVGGGWEGGVSGPQGGPISAL